MLIDVEVTLRTTACLQGAPSNPAAEKGIPRPAVSRKRTWCTFAEVVAKVIEPLGIQGNS